MQRAIRGRTRPYRVAIHSDRKIAAPELARLRQAVTKVLREASVARAEISIAVVDDATMAELNERFLQHQGPTDVLTFPLSHSADLLEGEIVVSADTAAAMAPKIGWSPADELLLYVIHGSLHLVGMDDLRPADARKMRAAEARHLTLFGLSQDPKPVPRKSSAPRVSARKS
jgi:probable rRNA maturation factor